MLSKCIQIFLIVAAAFLSVAPTVSSQEIVESYKFDIGAGIGMSGYLGDANESNFLKHPGFAANAGLRYLINSRFAAKAQLDFATISGNTAEFENALPGGAQYEFKSSVFDLMIKGEANFFAYGIGETYKRLRRWTPYVTLGVGVAMASSAGNTSAAFSIPMGVGVKFKISQRLNLNAEFAMTKVFGDQIDSKELTDLYQIKSSFLKNTDWYSTLSVGISYEFGPRCVTCNRID